MLRYIADVKLSQLGTPTAQAEIGAALAMLGDKVRAQKAFRTAASALPIETITTHGRIDFGSRLRDAAAVVTLAAEGNAAKPILVNATKQIGEARNRVRYTSTQDDAWLVLAARALGQQNVSLDVVKGSSDEGTLTGPRRLFVDYLSPLKRNMVKKKLEKQRKVAAKEAEEHLVI